MLVALEAALLGPLLMALAEEALEVLPLLVPTAAAVLAALLEVLLAVPPVEDQTTVVPCSAEK